MWSGGTRPASWGRGRVPHGFLMNEIGVLGLGNVLMGDDAFGPYVIKHLESAFRFPPPVLVLDAGTPGLDLTVHIRGLRALIVADAVKAPGPPGEVRLYRKADLLKAAPTLRMGPHEPGLREALLTLEFSGGAPEEVLLVGAIPDDVVYRVGLSAPVQEAVPAAVAEILHELDRLGAPAEPRETPLAMDLWWEAVEGER